MPVAFDAAKIPAINWPAHHTNKRIQVAGLALLATFSALTIAWAQVSVATAASLAVLNGCLAFAVFLNTGRLWQGTAANLAWLSSAALAVNLLDSWAYTALFPDVKGIVLAATPGVIALAIWLANFSVEEPRRNAKWKALSLFWLALAEALWITVAYFQNQRGLFWAALLLLFSTLILSIRFLLREKKWWLLPLLITLVVLGVILYLIQGSEPLSPFMYSR